METAILTANGIEVYQSEIDIVCKEYIDSLFNPEMISKSSVFSGMLFEISKRIIKPFLEADKQNRNSKQHNFELLNAVFYNIYIPVCNRFNICPSVLLFSVLCDISNEHLSDIRNGIYRSNKSVVTPANTQTVKNWYAVCESMLLSKAVNESSIGSIFALKANYNYNDSLQKVEVINSTNSLNTPEQIMEKYKGIQPPIIDMEADTSAK